MTNSDIEKTLKEYKESYAPWEMEEMDCQMYETDKMVDFGRRMYIEGLKAKGAYILVRWPETQVLMDEEWFDSECFLADMKNDTIGNSAYFIPAERLKAYLPDQYK